MSAFEVNFYYKADGSCPVRDFLDTLDDKMLAKLLGTISLLEANGTQLREPYSKSLGAVSYTHLTLPTTERV